MVCQLLASRDRDGAGFDRSWTNRIAGLLPLLGLLALAAPAAASTPAGRTVPAALRPALYGALARDAGPAFAIGKNGCAAVAKQPLRACFGPAGGRFLATANPPLVLRLAAWGRGHALRAVTPVAPAVAGNRASYAHAGLTEWWRVLPLGFEQGFTVTRRPAGRAQLVLALAASGKPKGKRGTLAFGSLRYGDLVVTDATGKVLPSRLTTHNGRILIAVNDARASYPLTVDPLIWLEQKLTASDGAIGDHFGSSVAVSGTTALVGAPSATINGNYNEGAAYVFEESNGVWTQTQKLTPSDGAAGYWFGSSVALEGSTALVGSLISVPNAPPGAVYVFNNSGGTWTQTQELVGTPANNNTYIFNFGNSVALSGTTALIGANLTNVNNSGTGAAYVFDDSGGTWTQTAQLSASDGGGSQFGASVALDGTTALAGAPDASVNGNNAQGAAYVFDDSGGTWTQTTKLTASDGAANDYFGWSVALSGTTAVAGAPFATINGNYNQGAAYVFDDSGGTWTQTQKLIASGSSQFGYSAALSGSDALIGAPYTVSSNGINGTGYLFTDSGGTWSQTQQLTATDGQGQDQAGSSVAFDGTTALVGATCADAPPGYNCGTGAAYLYAPGNLALAFSAPNSVTQAQRFIAQTIVTNAAGTASPAVAVTVAVPAAAAFVSANVTQGSCSESAGTVTCALGQIAGNGGTATANVKFKATGSAGTTIDNAVGIAKAVPALTASAPTATGGCPGGYSEHDGTLNPGGSYHAPAYQAPAGTENGSLGGPSGFQLYVQYSNGTIQHTYRIHGNEVHHYGPAGTYRWDVQAGLYAGGAYTLCVMHP